MSNSNKIYVARLHAKITIAQHVGVKRLNVSMNEDLKLGQTERKISILQLDGQERASDILQINYTIEWAKHCSLGQ